MEKFDLVVIGAGPSGYAAAMRALDFKKRVLLIEKNSVGGAGVANGALSSKTWWELSREASSFRKNLKRYNITAPSISYEEIQREVQKALKERKGMLEEHMNNLNTSAYANLLKYKIGEAKLLSQHEVEILHGTQREVVFADYVILATGHSARDIYDICHNRGVELEMKPFAMGVRYCFTTINCSCTPAGNGARWKSFTA